MGQQLTGLRALVTGAASGIGLATATRLLAEGGVVVALDRAPQRPDGMDPAIGYVTADIGSPAAVRDAVGSAVASLGGLDLLVNCAGIGAQGTVAQATDEDWRRVLDVNVIGTARVCREAWPHLEASEAAAIVNVASMAAAVGLPDRAVYTASKGAVLSLSYAMAADGLAAGIRVNAVNPGTVDTPWVARLLADSPDPGSRRRSLEARQPLGRLVTTEEVVHAIVYLASPAAAAITGTALAVDGGLQTLRVPAAATH
jgi:NAD(P)-dependent dehydrogenase (short-subunit alcohol dehydrogenase family)